MSKKGCSNCSGKVVCDVSIRGDSAHCRRCGNKLELDKLDEDTKEIIKYRKEKNEKKKR